MFSIGEFSRLGGVSVRTLRHYDDIADVAQQVFETQLRFTRPGTPPAG